MRRRCNDPNNNKYQNYGGRGIKICKRWMKFKNFVEDMGECPLGLSLDRKNNNKNYCKSNCRWTTLREQQRNKRNNRLITVFGKTQCIAVWAEEFNIPYFTLYARIIKLDWLTEKALITPVRKKGKK